MDRQFTDSSMPPDDAALRDALGGAFERYRTLLDLASGFDREWACSKSSGWMLKVHDRKKALLYVIPLHEGFRVSLAVRETERDAFLRDDGLAVLHGTISTARKVAEGFALAFEVEAGSDFSPVESLVRKLIQARV
jgi:hypothetical protein